MFGKTLFDKIKSSHRLSAILVVLIMASLGTYFLVGGHAASPYASTTATGGTLAKGAVNCSSAGSSTGNAVTFNSPMPMDGTVALDLSCPGTPFSPTSFWNTLVPANVALNPNSTDYANEISNQVCYGFRTFSTAPTVCPAANGNTSALNTSDWSSPLYVVPANQPLVPVSTYCGQGITDDDMSDGNWKSANWTTTTTSATHTTGNTDALSSSQFEPVPSTEYQVSYTFSGSPATGSTIAVTMGSTTVGSYTFSSSTPGADNFTVTKTITTASGASGFLTFTPSSTFNGTISAVSVLPYKAGLATAVAGGVPIPADAHGSGHANAPVPPTIDNHGSAGSTTYWYAIAAVEANSTSTEISSNGSMGTGNATLSATNYNIVSWTPAASAVQYKIYRVYSSSSTTPSSGLIGTVTTNGSTAPQTFDDTGMVATTATPYGDTDKAIQIYQPSTNKEWEFWEFQKYDSSGVWGACWGGVMNNVSQSNGIFPNYGGSTATSLPLLGGIPRIDEFRAGQINHVMNLSLGENFYRTAIVPATTPPTYTFPANVTDPGDLAYSWPATRNDGGNSSTLAIPEGQRFILNPNLNLSTLGLSPMAMTIAVAAQRYGFVVVDSSGSVSIRLPDPTTYTVAGLPNPYTSGPGVGGVGNQGLYGGGGQIMKNFPWGQLEALPFNYGEPGS